MARKFAHVVLSTVLLSMPLVLWADSNPDYQNRGTLYEGVRPKPVSGNDIEVISVLADYHELAERLPEHLRVGFYLPGQTAVHLAVREQDYRLYYWLDKVERSSGFVARPDMLGRSPPCFSRTHGCCVQQSGWMDRWALSRSPGSCEFLGTPVERIPTHLFA